MEKVFERDLPFVKSGICPKCNTKNECETLGKSKYFKIIQCKTCKQLFIASNMDNVKQLFQTK